MIQKIKQWWRVRKFYREGKEANAKAFIAGNGEFYTKEHVVKQAVEAFNAGYKAGHTDGKKDGLALARVQATNALKSILKEQNK